MQLTLFGLFSHYYANLGIGLQLGNYSLRLEKNKFSSNAMKALKFGILISDIRNIKSPKKFLDSERNLPLYTRLDEDTRKNIDELGVVFEKLFDYCDREIFCEEVERALNSEDDTALQNILNEINTHNLLFMEKMRELKKFKTTYLII